MKTVLIRLHGITAPHDFGINKLDRNDQQIAERRRQLGITTGRCIDFDKGCRTDQVLTELTAAGLMLVDIHQQMTGKLKQTPVLVMNFSDQGQVFKPTFNLSFDSWLSSRQRPMTEADMPEWVERMQARFEAVMAALPGRYERWFNSLLAKSWEAGQIWLNEGNLSLNVTGAIPLQASHEPLSVSFLLETIEA